MPDEQEMKDEPRIETPGRKVTVFEYGASGGVMIPEEVMTAFGIEKGTQVRWITQIGPDGKSLVLRKDE